MSVASTDLVWYFAATESSADGVTVGGAIDTTSVVVPASASLFNALSDGKVDVVSSNSGDTTQTLTVYGRADSGSIISEALSLNGNTLVNGTNTYNRLEYAVLSAAAAGTITLTAHSGGSTIFTLAAGQKKISRPLYNVSADVSGGSSRTFYEKLFVKNTNSTNALLGAVVSKFADPASVMTFGVATAVNDSQTATNRQTAPSGVTFTTTGTQTETTATTDLAAGAAQGVWWAMTLSAGATATVTTFTPQIAGSTT